MALFVEPLKYGAIHITDATTHLFYVIMFTSEAYTLQDSTTIDGQSGGGKHRGVTGIR